MKLAFAIVLTIAALASAIAFSDSVSAQLKPECRPPGYNPKDLGQCTKACQCNGGSSATYCADWCKRNQGSK